MTFHVHISYTSEYQQVAQIVVPKWMDYCHKHGYVLTVDQDLDDQHSGLWSRYNRIDECRADWYVHVDVDAVVTNPSVTLESIIDSMPRYTHFIVGTDTNGINDGVFFVRNNQIGRHIVDLIKAKMTDVWCGQDVLDTDFKGNPYVWAAPQRLFNSYLYQQYGETHPDGEWQEGDFILHLPGIANDKRAEILKKIV